jgi:hypothetical protein
MLALDPRRAARGLEHAPSFRRAGHEIVELAVHPCGLRVLETLSDDCGRESGVDGDVVAQESQRAHVVHVPVGEQHAVDAVDLAILRVIAIAGPEVGIVGREIVAVQPLERRDEPHPQVVAQAERRAARLHEFFEEASHGPEPHAEIEQPAAVGPLEEDPIATDLAGGAAVDGERHRVGHGSI